MKNPLTLKDTAELESYTYFDENIRSLPRNSDGTYDTSNPIFTDSDVDAFRHAYVSGIFTHEYNERVATLLGWLNEFIPIPSSISNTNMDLWNNEIGRKLALTHKTKDALLIAIKKALQSGDLIVSPSDIRVYEGAILPKPEGDRSVIVLEESETGANDWFFDMSHSKIMSREQFVSEIKAGIYPSYSTRKISGVDYPVSKRDSSKAGLSPIA